MQNNIFSNINISTRIIVLLLLIFSIFIAKSIYLLIFLTLLCVILMMLTKKSVKFYIDSIKNVKFWLLFIFIAYIIICRNVLVSLGFIYKVILSVLIVKQFCISVNFCTLTNGFMTLLNFIGVRLKSDKISYNIVNFIYFINTYIKSKKEIFSKYDSEKKLKYQFSFKHNIFPRMFLTMSKMERFESNLKLKFYKPKLEEKNLQSKIVLLTFLVLFITVVLKEVIL